MVKEATTILDRVVNNPTSKKHFKEVSWEEILKENKNLDIIMTEEQMKKLMEKLGIKIDKNGQMFDTKNNKIIKSNSNENITYHDIGAILSCCRIIVDKDIYNYAQYITKYCR